MFSIDYRSRTPLYQQLIENIEQLVLRGVLTADTQLPSVRSLAVELSINPNTVSRAITELESRGIIYTVPGRGSFIAADQTALLDRAEGKLRSSLMEFAKSAHQLGLGKENWLHLCEQAYSNSTEATSSLKEDTPHA